MSRFLTILYDTSGWSDGQLNEVCSDKSARVLSWSHKWVTTEISKKSKKPSILSNRLILKGDK